jgi:glycosyltransferase involved in cell wall biosynthesis
LLLQKRGKHDIHLLLLGNGASKASLLMRSSQLGLKNVTFLDSVPKSEVVRYWSLLDVSIIHLRKTDLFKTVIPSKMFECMAMGIPILHGVEGESAEIVRSEQVGLTFEPENVLGLCDGISRLKENPDILATFKQNGPIAAKRYDRRRLAETMMAHLERTALSG